ncbi:unnamed protein product, partial [Staurois parvus]
MIGTSHRGLIQRSKEVISCITVPRYLCNLIWQCIIQFSFSISFV